MTDDNLTDVFTHTFGWPFRGTSWVRGEVEFLVDKSKKLLAQRIWDNPFSPVNLISPRIRASDLTLAMLCTSASSLYPPSSLVNPGNAEYVC